MKKIRAGIIGCGFIANGKHLPSMTRVEGIEPVAFCDIIPERAENTAKKYGAPDVLICTDYHDVLARPDIDVIQVCTPNSSHAEITVAALEAGKQVMCEKPMAKTAAGAKLMLEAAKKTGNLLTIGYQNRYRDDSMFMKDLCEKGELGEIYLGKAFATRRRGVPTWGVFMDKEKQGGGPLIDLATHALDLTMWMMDNYEPDTVLGSTFNKIGKLGSPANSMGPWDPDTFEVEDSAFGFVRFKNGATIMVEASWAINMIIANEAMTMLCGTKGGADMFPPNGPIVRTSDFQSLGAGNIRFNGENNGKLFVQNYTMGEAFIGGGEKETFSGGTREMQTWVNAVGGEGELVVKPEQAYMVTCVLEAIYKSAQSGDIYKF